MMRLKCTLALFCALLMVALLMVSCADSSTDNAAKESNLAYESNVSNIAYESNESNLAYESNVSNIAYESNMSNLAYDKNEYAPTIAGLVETSCGDSASPIDYDYESFFITEWTTVFVYLDKTSNFPKLKENVSPDGEIVLPLVEGGNYNFKVYWGDGATSTITKHDAPEKRHKYEKNGKYRIVMEGTIEGWQFLFENPDPKPDSEKRHSQDAVKLLKVCQWGSLAFGDTEGQLFGTTNIQIPAVDAPNLMNTRSLKSAFVSSLILNSKLEHWDVSKVTNMSYMFNTAIAFNEELKEWDVSSVTDMSYMFDFAIAFNQELKEWDVSSVEDMSGMFTNANNFDQELDDWDVSSVKNMQDMFRETANFNQPLNKWGEKVGNVTSMNYMFALVGSFNQNLKDWNVSSVASCKGFNAVSSGEPIFKEENFPEFVCDPSQ